MSDCLSENTLAELLEGCLSGEERATAEHHLASCSFCREVLAKTSQEYLGDTHTPTLVEGGGGPSVPPARPATPTEHTASGRAADYLLSRGAELGRYVILGAVGAGGMGVVYAAYDPELDRKIALKLLRPEYAPRPKLADVRGLLHREAKAMARLSHPNVISVYDIGTFGDQVFLAMEFIEGRTLHEWLQEKPRSWRQVLELFREAGEGLEAAHGAGLVHRDFKPENVLVGWDGRVRVTDFGLARFVLTSVQSADSELAEQRAAIPGNAAITKVGALIGTPSYMSPEQIAGGAVDLRSDIFSFCVTLYESLYGERPFSGESLPQLQAALQSGEISAPSRGGAPPWLRRVILRGLRSDPDERYPTMKALLADLARDPSRTRRKALFVGGFVGLAGVIALGVTLSGGPDLLCKGAERKLEGVWDSGRKQAIRNAFLATGKPYAEDAWQGTQRALDAYGQSWVTMHTQACEATRLRGEQSEQLLDIRMQCLGQRLKEMRALTALFAAPDARVLTRSVQAAHALSSLESCADVAELTVRAAPRLPPAVRGRVDEIGTRLAEAKALRVAGKHREGLALAERAEREARGIEYRPIHAQALYLLGRSQASAGRFREAERTLFDALCAAEAGWEERLRARAARSLVLVVGNQQARYAEGHRWAKYAAAAVERVGGDSLLEAELGMEIGILLSREGRYAEALSHHEGALKLFRRTLTPDHPDIGRALNNVGLALEGLGRYDEAAAYYQEALALWARVLGPRHPTVAISHNNLANVLAEKERYPEALSHYQQAVGIREGAFGLEHPAVAQTLNNLGLAQLALGETKRALTAYRRALAIFTKAHGEEHPDVAMCLGNIGEALEKDGRHAEALANLQRAVALWEKVAGPAHPNLADPLFTQGTVFLAQGQAAAALASYRRSRAIREKALGPKHPKLAESLTGEGEALLAGRDPRGATEVLERAVTLAQAAALGPTARARARFALARALWAQGRDRLRALRLAGEARDGYARAGAATRYELAAVVAWLRER
jgi:tetratricopeptide (TPR) repeat protein